VFELVVEASVEITGRGVSVIGRLTVGAKPEIGTAVAIATAGRPPVRAVV
jgi:hypothetical protein